MAIHDNTTAATITQNTIVQMLTTHFRSIQWLQIEFGDQKIFLIVFQPRLQAIREPESILLAKGFFIYGDKIAKNTPNVTTTPNIISSSFSYIKTRFIITKLYHQMTKKSKIRYIYVIKQKKISKIGINNRIITHEK